MGLELLIATMHQKDFSLVERMNVGSDAVVINQCDEDGTHEFKFRGHTVRWFNTTERGLSRSRNMALKNAREEICLLCDDDETLIDGYSQIVENTFLEYPKADLIAFDFIKVHKTKRYKKSFEYGNSSVVKKAPRFKTYCSIQLAFRRQRILENELYFDPRFGAGSQLISSGEESVWQNAAKKKGLLLLHAPEVIAKLNQQESTWFSQINAKYYYDLGACLGVSYPFLCHLLKYYYVINIHGKTLPALEQLKWLRAGIRQFKKNGYSYEEYLSRKEKK